MMVTRGVKCLMKKICKETKKSNSRQQIKFFICDPVRKFSLINRNYSVTSRVLNFTMCASLLGCSQTHFEAIPVGPSAIVTAPIPVPDNPANPSKASETFIQSDAGNQIDILIVNDNSISMDEEQKKLAARFNSFVGSIADIDYRIGMTTTDLDSQNYNQGGRLLNWSGTQTPVLTPNTANASEIFAASVVRQETLNCDGTAAGCPSGNEQALKSTIAAIDQRFTANAGFFREKAPLIVVVLGDEDERSGNLANATTSSEVMNSVTGAFGLEKTFVFFGIIIKSGDTKCLEEQKLQSGGTATYGTRVEELALATNGQTISICENDFSRPLADLSRSMRRLITAFTLKKAPKDGKVKIKFTPHAHHKYTVEGNKIVFDTPPAIGTKIDVDYDP